MIAYQRTLEGGIKVATGNAIRDQLAAIMEAEPETIDDEDLLATKWLDQQGLIPWFENYPITTAQVTSIIRSYRKANIRERRRELTKSGLYSYSPEEQARRQKRGKGGPPG